MPFNFLETVPLSRKYEYFMTFLSIKTDRFEMDYDEYLSCCLKFVWQLAGSLWKAPKMKVDCNCIVLVLGHFLLHLDHSLIGLKCSSCEPFPGGATNILSRSNSDENSFSEKRRASVMYHPEGESSTAPFFSTDSSLNLPVLEVGRTENTIFSSTTLPRPGDPGAPPLPPELQLEEQVPCSNSSEMFLPLRSRALSRQWRRPAISTAQQWQKVS